MHWIENLRARSGSFLAVGMLAIVGASFGVGYLVGERVPYGSQIAAAAGVPGEADLSPVWKAWRLIEDNFVPAAVSTTTAVATTTEDFNEQRIYGMISGLAESYNDPYTFFLPPAENKQFAADMSGSFEGVGMQIDVKDGVLVVVSPLKGTPASKAGIKAGDQIIKIDSESTQGLDVTQAVRKIRGPKGTTVVLTLLRSTWNAPREIKVVRDVIKVPIISTESREDGVFVISFAEFTATSPGLFRNALREFIESGKPMLVLDLRGNPGGYLEAAVEAASWFLPSGAIVVSEDYANHQSNVVHRSNGYDIFNKNLRMVVLIDQGTASASEILAGALRAHGVAELVGTHTFGKGVVQQLFPVTDDTSIKITVARWLDPNGVQIPHDGIKPDYEVEITDEDRKAGKDPQLDKAIELLKGSI